MIRNKCSKCGGWDSSVPHKWRVINGQYIKSMRLHEARLLLARQGQTVAEVADKNGNMWCNDCVMLIAFGVIEFH